MEDKIKSNILKSKPIVCFDSFAISNPQLGKIYTQRCGIPSLLKNEKIPFCPICKKNLLFMFQVIIPPKNIKLLKIFKCEGFVKKNGKLKYFTHTDKRNYGDSKFIPLHGHLFYINITPLSNYKSKYIFPKKILKNSNVVYYGNWKKTKMLKPLYYFIPDSILNKINKKIIKSLHSWYSKLKFSHKFEIERKITYGGYKVPFQISGSEPDYLKWNRKYNGLSFFYSYDGMYYTVKGKNIYFDRD